ncbi:hypothetical protein SDC9_81060 [bioreactor metagenome]|uniref:Uncharacterized protein n=1 Tax=bioreactor metagenome TaxID=1076179 RepID=A0A644Z1I0_9ZZZZ
MNVVQQRTFNAAATYLNLEVASVGRQPLAQIQRLISIRTGECRHRHSGLVCHGARWRWRHRSSGINLQNLVLTSSNQGVQAAYRKALNGVVVGKGFQLQIGQVAGRVTQLGPSPGSTQVQAAWAETQGAEIGKACVLRLQGPILKRDQTAVAATGEPDGIVTVHFQRHRRRGHPCRKGLPAIV